MHLHFNCGVIVIVAVVWRTVPLSHPLITGPAVNGRAQDPHASTATWPIIKYFSLLPSADSMSMPERARRLHARMHGSEFIRPSYPKIEHLGRTIPNVVG